MVYVEYVERDSNGNPINVYITEGNTLGEGKFNPQYDGVVKKMTFEDFKNRSQVNELAGYIAANK